MKQIQKNFEWCVYLSIYKFCDFYYLKENKLNNNYLF